MKDLAQARNISLYSNDWCLVERIAARSGVRSMSGGLRVLIADYRRLTEMVMGERGLLAPCQYESPESERRPEDAL